MKNLRDIEVKKCDKVYFEDGDIVGANRWPRRFSNYQEIENDNCKIIKIERPVKYETIYEAPKQILDKEEKKYLENVIRPFKDKVDAIAKYWSYDESRKKHRKEYIAIAVQVEASSRGLICLPCFKAGSMYKGMEARKDYTIEELGLFEGESK